jgi:multicomponent Na+:H+ antiporter subunit G
MIGEWTVAAFILVGVLFSLLAAIGLLRMPDLYMRIQASTKSSTLGVSCIALAAALHFDDVSVTTKAVLIVAFLFLTAPVAAHMIGYAAYVAGVELWPQTVVDELRPLELDRAADAEAAGGSE